MYLSDLVRCYDDVKLYDLYANVMEMVYSAALAAWLGFVQSGGEEAWS